MPWLVNVGDTDVDIIVPEERRQRIFKPNVPVEIPDVHVMLSLLKRYNGTLKSVTNPQDYFQDRRMRQMVLRDAGIGDLLLLEPILRKLDAGGREMTVASCFKEIYDGNPAVARSIDLSSVGKDVNPADWDSCEDIRQYSETCESRNKKHRTDCYCEPFNVDLAADDREPRLYLPAEPARPKDWKRRIGISVEASHKYRAYRRLDELCEAVLGLGYIPVVFGRERTATLPVGAVDRRGETTIPELIQEVAGCAALVAVDSGVMHIALALHVPTICIFSIITPDLRLRYYTGAREVMTGPVGCIGCGDWHMDFCKHEDRGRELKDFHPPCMAKLEPDDLAAAAAAIIPRGEGLRWFQSEQRTVAPLIEPSGVIPKISLALISYNEAVNVPRFVQRVMKHPNIGRVVCVDGGSKDNTADLIRAAGAQVYVHRYDHEYHDAQALQRNISLSFMRDGERVLIMDFDECFSNELARHLPTLAVSDIVYGEISRRTFNYFADIADPTKQIKDYPDWQPRFYRWNRRFKFVGSPHHQMHNVPPSVKIQKDIIHFEREGKDRDALEKTWSKMQARTKEVYGR